MIEVEEINWAHAQLPEGVIAVVEIVSETSADAEAFEIIEEG